MKKIIFLILFFSFTTLFGQTLKFDVMAKYLVTDKYQHSTHEGSGYAISSNDNYMMKVKNPTTKGEQYIAYVYDLKKLKKHVYNIVESRSEKGDINYKFIYINTNTFSRTPMELYFDFQSISNEGDFEIVKLSHFKNKNKTKNIGSLEFKILKSEANLFPLFRFICLHPSEFIMELNYVNKGLVTYCVSENGLIEYKLVAFEESNLELTLPN